MKIGNHDSEISSACTKCDCGEVHVLLENGTPCCMGTLNKFKALYGYMPVHCQTTKESI